MATISSNSSGMQRKPQQNRSQERVNQILDVAEQLLIEGGHKATTTRAIAARSQIPIGSLYQFFPDKEAIFKALAMRYNQQMYEMVKILHTQAAVTMPLSMYVDRAVDTFDQFFVEHPGYQAIFIQSQDLLPVLEEVDAGFASQLIEESAAFLAQRAPSIDLTKHKLAALLIVEGAGQLLWMSLGRYKALREQLLPEIKALVLAYLQQHLNVE